MKIPILRLGDLLLTSIQIELSDEDATDFQADLVRMVERVEPVGVVIDVTALEVVDSFIARVINDTASAVRLLGAEVVVCGIQPAVALTLIEMGRDLLGVETALNLDKGMAKLRQRVARRDARPGERADVGD